MQGDEVMKILITSDLYKPSINGVVASILSLKQGLEERGHEVKILTLSPNMNSYVEGDVTYIGSLNAGKVYPGARLRYALAHPLLDALIAWKPDVVHSNCELSTFLMARKIAKRSGCPLVHTYHTVYEDYTHYFSPSRRVGKSIVRKLSRVIARRTDTIVVPSVKVLKLLEGYDVETPLDVIPTGIDQKKFSEHTDLDVAELRKKCGIPEENTVVISIGRLAKEKNIEELIDYMKAFAGEPVTLLIVGDGPYRRDLEKAAAKSGLPKEQIVFYGAVPPSEVGEYYHMGDIFVNSSTSETQGLTYFEALSCGLPVLAREDSCLEGVVEPGVNGWEYTDCVGFEEHLRWYLTHKEAHEQMRLAALKTGARFSVQAFAASVENLYNKLIEENKTIRDARSRASRMKIHVRATVRKLKRTRMLKTAGHVVSKIIH